MKQFRALIIGFTLLSLMALSACSQDNPKVVLIGNSIVDEYPYAIDGCDVIKASVVDFTSKQMTWIFDWAIVPKNPDIGIVIGGQEDFLLGIPPATVADNFMEVVAMLRENGIRPILTSVIFFPHDAELNARVEEHNALLKERCKEADVEFIDLNAYLSGLNELLPVYRTHNRHLNERAAETINELLAAYLSGNMPAVPERRVIGPTRGYTFVDLQYLSGERIARIEREAPETVHIVMLGNSITEGGGDWNVLLDRTDVKNAGQGGYTTGQMLWHFKKTVLQSGADTCFIMGGVNDISVGVPEEVILDNVKTMAEQLKGRGIEPVIQSTFYQLDNPVSYPVITRHNERLQAFCREAGIDYLDLNAVMSDENGLKRELTTDGTHLTEAGYREWAAFLKEYIRQ